MGIPPKPSSGGQGSGPSVTTTTPTQPTAPAPGASPAAPGPSAAPPPNMTAPSPLPAPGAPTGPVVTTAPCCPDVATFEGSTGARSTYFGFDDKTNLVATVGTDEYWNPPAAAKTLPSSKEERDGARWVSVGIGAETRVEISFGGTYTNNCLPNCTFEVAPASIAEVVTPNITASGVDFKIKGKAAGEASLKVMCDGKLRGYFHIWCAAPVTIKLDICTIKTANVAAASYTTGTIKTAVEEIFRQAMISFSIRDLGTVDVSGDADAVAAETAVLSATHFNTTKDFTSKMHAAAEKVLQKRAAPPPPPPSQRQAPGPGGHGARLAAAAAAAAIAPPGPPPVLARTGAYRLYLYIPTGVRLNAAGTVINIGSSPAFSYFQSAGASENSIAHELGHCLGLRHPSDGSVGTQIAAHLLATKNAATVAIPATNTEPAVPAASAAGNIMAADPCNLMGYWRTKVDRKPIRYTQWKACSRT